MLSAAQPIRGGPTRRRWSRVSDPAPAQRSGQGPVDQNVSVTALAATNRVRSPDMVATVDIRGNDTHDGDCAIDQLVDMLNFPASTLEIQRTLACTLMGPPFALHARRLVAIGILLIGFITCVTVADAVAVSAPTSTAVSTSGNGVEPKADEVVVGAYIENIQTLDLATNSFMADIYVWMRWMNPELAPYESLEVMNP